MILLLVVVILIMVGLILFVLVLPIVGVLLLTVAIVILTLRMARHFQRRVLFWCQKDVLVYDAMKDGKPQENLFVHKSSRESTVSENLVDNIHQDLPIRSVLYNQQAMFVRLIDRSID